MGARITEKHAVFSAHAEVVPLLGGAAAAGGGILRARGGSSRVDHEFHGLTGYSPRTRR